MNNTDYTHIVTANVSPVRAKPDSDSEQETQCVLGQAVKAYQSQGEWTYIYTLQDDAFGWIRSVALVPADRFDDPYPSGSPTMRVSSLVADVYTQPSRSSLMRTKLTLGVRLPVTDTSENWVQTLLPDKTACWIDRSHVQIETAGERLENRSLADSIIACAQRFIGVPYLWGGCTPFGIDCSGFVQLVYRFNGIILPRNAQQQCEYQKCRTIERSQIRKADLVFFHGKERSIGHVGIALDDHCFVHSCGPRGVCISELSEQRYDSIYASAGRVL